MSGGKADSPGHHALDVLEYRATLESNTIRTAQLQAHARGKDSEDLWRLGSKLYDKLPAACRNVQEHVYLYRRANGEADHHAKRASTGNPKAEQHSSKEVGEVKVISSIPVPPVMRRATHQNYHPRFDGKSGWSGKRLDPDNLYTDIPGSMMRQKRYESDPTKVKKEYEPLYYKNYGIYGDLPVYPRDQPAVSTLPPQVLVNGQKVDLQAGSNGDVPNVAVKMGGGSSGAQNGIVTDSGDLYAVPHRKKNVATVQLD